MSFKDTCYNIKRALVSWGADIRFYKGGIILFGSSYYKLKGYHIRSILTLVEPGDILLRKYDHYLGSRLIPGFWSHASIYVGDEVVVHMLGHGITVEDILTFTRADHMLILRHENRDVALKAVARAIELSRRPHPIEYDYNFDETDISKFYCTEFVNVCYDNIVNSYMKGKDIMPDDFLRVPQLKKIWSDLEN
jgi:hypothetical protein